MLHDFLRRITQQARTIWQVATGTATRRNHEALDLFLTSGHTVPRISALLAPGLGGPPLLDKQRAIEQAIRAYTLDQEQQVRKLREEVQQLRLQAQQAAAQAHAAHQAQQTMQTNGALLGELLGIGGTP